jgi:hypothetical protein
MFFHDTGGNVIKVERAFRISFPSQV